MEIDVFSEASYAFLKTYGILPAGAAIWGSSCKATWWCRIQGVIVRPEFTFERAVSCRVYLFFQVCAAELVDFALAEVRQILGTSWVLGGFDWQLDRVPWVACCQHHM